MIYINNRILIIIRIFIKFKMITLCQDVSNIFNKDMCNLVSNKNNNEKEKR